MLYQIVVVIIAILAILLVFQRFHKKKTSLQTFILWIILWIFLAIFGIIPDSSTFLANFLGIGRGLDLILIFGIIGAYYLVFRLYLKIEKLDQDITKLIRLIAIDNEEKEEKEEK
ncbi:MAG: DUF2304 family protein [Methanobrevibacter sp.]|jgi:hypothetical protein|nr:DUF2304 family protein [Methanobrevibacter sp.]